MTPSNVLVSNDEDRRSSRAVHSVQKEVWKMGHKTFGRIRNNTPKKHVDKSLQSQLKLREQSFKSSLIEFRLDNSNGGCLSRAMERAISNARSGILSKRLDRRVWVIAADTAMVSLRRLRTDRFAWQATVTSKLEDAPPLLWVAVHSDPRPAAFLQTHSKGEFFSKLSRN